MKPTFEKISQQREVGREKLGERTRAGRRMTAESAPAMPPRTHFDPLQKVDVPARFDDPQSRASARSRVRILETALRLFGALGFADTSVRLLAAEAEVNLAAVNYHFGSKENLWTQALRYGFSHTVESLHKMQAQLVLVAQKGGTVEAAEEALSGCIRIFVTKVVGPEHKHWAMFMRERMSPGPALEIIMREYFEPMGRVMGEVLRLLLPEHPQEKVNLCITSIIGQCVHLRMSAPTIRLFSGQNPTSPEFLEMAAAHIADFSIQALRGMRTELAAQGTPEARES